MNRGETVQLLKPMVELGPSYVAMIQECIEIGEGYPYNNIDAAQTDFAAFVQELDEEARGIGLPAGIPPQQTYLLVRNTTTVLGEIRFRPMLPLPYEAYNGHIGYNIRPSERGKGYATLQLTLLLDQARAQGVSGVMLTIEGANPGSVRVIEKNHGRFVRSANIDGQLVACYWIDLSTPEH